MFFITFFAVLTLSYLVLLALDFYPESPEEVNTSEANVALEAQASNVQAEEMETLPEPIEVTEDEYDVAVATHTDPSAAMPAELYIPRLDRSVDILNPTSRTIADLDEALLDGVVRHPDSANLQQEGNLFVLGHSSYLPNVFNKNFQAFNGIQELEWGDEIKVYSETHEYTYRVDRVYRARAQDVTVPIAGTGHKLTLATCNSFGSVDDRYIVEASRIGTEKL